MKPEAQRLAIAEACGWTQQEWQEPDGACLGWVTPAGKQTYNTTVNQLPDYLNDLNAVHEAEKVLTTETQQYNFINILYDLAHGYKPEEAQEWTPPYWEVGSANVFAHIHATASQRAEAFLRTLNLYTA